MIAVERALDTVLERAKRLTPGQALDLRSYKRNRSVMVVRETQDFAVVEDGFEKQRFEGVTQAKLKKLLKTLIAREFPRSTKLRLDSSEKLPRKVI